MIISDLQLAELKKTLESVVNQPFRQELAENTEQTLLCAWKNETQVNYIIHIMRRRYDTYQVCLAVQRFRDIRTCYDRPLSYLEMHRFFSDPRGCVRYWVGQVTDFHGY